MNSVIRIAKKEDLIYVEKIYNRVHDYEETNGNLTNWIRGVYPTMHTAIEAYNENTLYVGETEGKIWGTMIINKNQLECYKKGNWRYDTDQVLVLHTLCIDPLCRHQGKAKEMINFYEAEAERKEMEVVRLDTYIGNVKAHNMYISLGYELAGNVECVFLNGKLERLYLYEKKITMKNIRGTK